MIKEERKKLIRNYYITSYPLIFDQRTFFSIIKLVPQRKREVYLFYYNAILKNRVLFKSTHSSIEIGVIVVKKRMPF